MPHEMKPNGPLNADPEPENPDQGTGPKAAGTLHKAVQPAANAEPENPDQNAGSGTGGGKGGAWSKTVKPEGRG